VNTESNEPSRRVKNLQVTSNLIAQNYMNLRGCLSELLSVVFDVLMFCIFPNEKFTALPARSIFMIATIR
jgi:hypothetical protein